MKMKIELVLGAVLCVASVSTNAAEPTTKPTLQDYKLVIDQNMFVRDRRAPRPIRDTNSGNNENLRTPEAIERYTILRGVVIEDDEYRAYVENTRLGGATKLSVGDAIGTGRVVEIAIDAVAFEAKGQVRWIEVGDNLQGISVAPPISASASSTTLPADTEGMSMVERLKARRAAEQQGKQ